MTRPVALAIIIVAALLAAVTLYALVAPAGGFTDNTPVARVNGETITRGRLEAALHAAHGGDGLQTLVDRRIVEQRAREMGLRVEPSHIETLLAQEEMQAGGPEQLDKRLAAEGRTRDDLRDELAAQARADRVLEAEVQVGETDIRAYYDAHAEEFRRGEMVRARLLLLDTRATAQTLLDVMDHPDFDFAQWARQISVDPATKDQGGDMGWIERGDYAKELTDAAFRLKPGQHTGIIEYPDGYAIIRVEARKPGGRQSLEEVRQTIDSLLRNQKLSALRYTWPAEQRKQARVTIRDPKLRRAYEAVREN
ncbi:MAG: hypothetical protein FJX74_05825 [Armatimonadetes bacterium]|nr:hypothetical protein [Armatimonadota bacterium]